ncbi:MAG TPA: SET domain-containing protein-lysine N-methyltransferase [Pyrinomonadaceae bacterium]|nr:SET domain-containing protein-lysine N-methyltransferase [Pyrinomonadaceae bacterium]
MLQLIETVHRRQQTISGEGKKSPSLSVTKSPIHGLGCFATSRFLKGNRIAEYAGEKISRKEAMRRMKRPYGKRISELEAEWYIDGSVDGNQTQYINHSCDPNADAVVIGGSLYIFALREIEPGKEITVDYLNSFEQDQSVCQCLTASCRRRIIQKAA